jgi:hypothetical protein
MSLYGFRLSIRLRYIPRHDSALQVLAFIKGKFSSPLNVWKQILCLEFYVSLFLALSDSNFKAAANCL